MYIHICVYVYVCVEQLDCGASGQVCYFNNGVNPSVGRCDPGSCVDGCGGKPAGYQECTGNRVKVCVNAGCPGEPLAWSTQNCGSGNCCDRTGPGTAACVNGGDCCVELSGNFRCNSFDEVCDDYDTACDTCSNTCTPGAKSCTAGGWRRCDGGCPATPAVVNEYLCVCVCVCVVNVYVNV
jgi:hypothetical protein